MRHAGDWGGGAALEESSTSHRFWLKGATIVAPGRKAITQLEWQSAQIALKREQTPYVWFDFLFEGEQRINNADPIGAVLNLAIALEAIIRTLATHNLSKERIEPVVLFVVDHANLRSILSRIRSLTFWNRDWERVTDMSGFNALMDQRDTLMHSAEVKNLYEGDLRKLYAKLKSFAYFASDFLEAKGYEPGKGAFIA